MSWYDELTLGQRQAANKAFASCAIDGGTATNDRLLFWDGFAAGLDYSINHSNPLQNDVDALLAYINGRITRAELESIIQVDQ